MAGAQIVSSRHVGAFAPAPSEHRSIDVNTTVDEALKLAYHGARAETPGFNITMVKDLDPKAGSIDAFPQEFLRVMLNLISNGFYAACKRADADRGPGASSRRCG